MTPIVLAAAHAATLDVPGTWPTVAAAVGVAQDGDTIQLSPGTYRETMSVAASVTIAGVGGSVVLEPDDPDDGFVRVDAGAFVTVRDVAVDGRSANRAFRVVQGTLVLQSVDVHDTRNAGTDGGAVLVEADPANLLTVSDSTFTGSTAAGGGHDGGAIAVLGGSAALLGTTLVGNAAETGAHLYSAAAELTIEDCVFESGDATKSGGAVYLAAGDVTIRRSWFTANESSTSRGGGAIYSEGPTALSVSDSWFRSNAALGTEGAARSTSGRTTRATCATSSASTPRPTRAVPCASTAAARPSRTTSSSRTGPPAAARSR